MKSPQAWRIYHHDAMNKTELTSSPSRVKKAREAGLTVVELVEKPKDNESYAQRQQLLETMFLRGVIGLEDYMMLLTSLIEEYKK